MHEKVTETEGKDNWDIMLLNWYCNNVHWKQCNRNSVGYSAKIASIPFTPNDKQLYDYTTKNKGGVDEFSIVPVQMFMSGSAYFSEYAAAIFDGGFGNDKVYFSLMSPELNSDGKPNFLRT